MLAPMDKDELAALLEEPANAKTFAELAQVVPHQGGLAQLAQAEQRALARTIPKDRTLH